MRTQLLGLAAATLAVGTLALGTTPAQAAGGIDSGRISPLGALPSEVDVVGTTPGDAVAAWVKPVEGGERIYAAHGTDGAWAAPVDVTHGVASAIENLHVVGNDAGDVAAVWTQTINGQERVRGARYLGGGKWDGPATLSGPDTTGIKETEAAMDGAGRVHVVIAASVQAAAPIRAALWAKGAAPVLTQVSPQGWFPSLDVTPSGVAVTAFEGLGEGRDIVKASRRTATTGWTTPDVALWPEDAGVPRVGVADNGIGTVLYRAQDGELARVVAANISATGQVSNPDIVSLPGAKVATMAIDVSPGGSAVASWAQSTGSGYELHVAHRPAVGDFGTPVLHDADTTLSVHPIPFESDTSRRVIVYEGDGRLTFRYRTSAVQGFKTYDGGASDGERAADTDSQGNVVGVSIVANGGSSYVQADWLDLTGPTSAPSSALEAQTLSRTFPVGWTATDALSSVQSTDVIVRTSAWNQAAFGDATVVGNNLKASPFAFKGAPGRTYCFETQSVDGLSNLGARSALRCTSVPLDDRALGAKGWTRANGSGHFEGTLTTTSTKGRTLTRAGIKAKRVALVAHRVPNGGKVEVRWNGTLVRTISLKGTAAKKKVYPITTWGSVRSGTLKVKVVSPTGRQVRIDGLVVAK